MDPKLESVCSPPFRIVDAVISAKIEKKKDGVARVPSAAASTITKEGASAIARIIKMLRK